MKKLIDGLLGVSLVVLLSFSCAQIGFAQSSSATIRGTILDPQARAIPNATVTVRNVDTGQERSTPTTNDGIYVIPNLPPGTYDVRVEVSGFSKGEAKSVKIEVGDTRDVNFILKLAGVSAEVKVSGETPLVETTKTDLSATINDKQMAGLPVFNTGLSALNDYENLATTAPGVRFDATGNSNDLLGPGAYNFRGNLVNVDGGNITDQVVSTRDALGASLDEVKEFQVITNNYNAEYGQAGSVILNVITKSGTNSFHGSGHAFFRGRNLAASDYFYNTFDPNAAFRRAPFQRQTWGLNGGGPIIKNKTFWFLNFEKVHQSVPLTLTHQPPNDTAVTVQQPDNEILWSAKLDHQLSTNHQLSFRFNVQRAIFDNQLVQVPQFASPQSLVGTLNHDHTLNVGLVSTVTPRVVNEARFFWHRYLNSIPTKSTLAGVRTSNSYTGAAFCCPQGGLQHRYQYLDNVTWTRGTHTIKGGVNISHFPYNSLFQQFHFGEYDERVATLTVGFGAAFVQTADTIYGLYLQDSWKLRPNLTFNYGVRYDYEDGGFKGGTQAKPGGGCFQANGIIPACSTDTNNWQPRVGLAWSPRFDSGVGHWLFGGSDQSVIRASFAEVTELAYLNVSLDSLNFDGVNLLTVTIPETPAIAQFRTSNAACSVNPPPQNVAPCIPPASVLAPFKPANFFGRIRPISDHLRNPESRHFNLDITRQIGNSYVVSAGYIGVLGFGQFGERDMNFPAILPDSSHPGFFFFGPRPDSRFVAIRTNENSRSSAYHGGYIKMEKRFSHHFQAGGYYIYSKTLASTEDFYGTSEPGDPRNIRAERGPAQNDIRHLATFSFVVDTSSLTKTSFVNHIVNNWSLGMVGTLHSGPHYPISTGEGPFSGSVFAGVGAETQQRPNVLPDGTLIATNIASRGGGNLQISQAGAAMCPTCTQTTFLAPSNADPGGPLDSITGSDVVDFQFLNGNLMRNIAVGDPLYRFDVSLSKTVKVTERVGLEFRVDAVNLFNRRNFTLFNGTDVLDNLSINTDNTCTNCIRAGGPLVGRYIGSDGRVMKLNDFLHGRVSKDLTNPIFGGAQASIGDPSSTDGPRRLQLSFRIHW